MDENPKAEDFKKWESHSSILASKRISDWFLVFLRWIETSQTGNQVPSPLRDFFGILFFYLSLVWRISDVIQCNQHTWSTRLITQVVECNYLKYATTGLLKSYFNQVGRGDLVWMRNKWNNGDWQSVAPLLPLLFLLFLLRPHSPCCPSSSVVSSGKKMEDRKNGRVASVEARDYESSRFFRMSLGISRILLEAIWDYLRVLAILSSVERNFYDIL